MSKSKSKTYIRWILLQIFNKKYEHFRVCKLCYIQIESIWFLGSFGIKSGRIWFFLVKINLLHCLYPANVSYYFVICTSFHIMYVLLFLMNKIYNFCIFFPFRKSVQIQEILCKMKKCIGPQQPLTPISSPEVQTPYQCYPQI